MITSLEQLIGAAASRGRRRALFVLPTGETLVSAAAASQERGLTSCTLIGDAGRIAALAGSAGIDAAAFELIDQPDEERAVEEALSLCRAGEADVLVSGGTPLRVLLPAMLDGETGLRAGRLLSGVSVVEPRGFGRLLLLSDGLLVVSPDLERRIGIVENAIHVAHRLGIEFPRVALLAATEAVDPKSPVSVEAAQITMMSRRRQIEGAIVDGPLGFDNAISAHAAQVKGIDSDVAGQVDVLIAPDLESGNLLLRTMACLCRAQVLDAIVGGRVPLLLSPPGGSVPMQVAQVALGVLLS
jgi:phosphotransacetylase